MNRLRLACIEYINVLLTLKGWHDISEPILFSHPFSGCSKNINDYFKDVIVLYELMNTPEYKLLIETLLSFDRALEDDWLPDTIEGLSISQAYLFLQEIKNILEEEIANDQIESELILRYNKVKEGK